MNPSSFSPSGPTDPNADPNNPNQQPATQRLPSGLLLRYRVSPQQQPPNGQQASNIFQGFQNAGARQSPNAPPQGQYQQPQTWGQFGQQALSRMGPLGSMASNAMGGQQGQQQLPNGGFSANNWGTAAKVADNFGLPGQIAGMVLNGIGKRKQQQKPPQPPASLGGQQQQQDDGSGYGSATTFNDDSDMYDY